MLTKNQDFEYKITSTPSYRPNWKIFPTDALAFIIGSALIEEESIKRVVFPHFRQRAKNDRETGFLAPIHYLKHYQSRVLL